MNQFYALILIASLILPLAGLPGRGQGLAAMGRRQQPQHGFGREGPAGVIHAGREEFQDRADRSGDGEERPLGRADRLPNTLSTPAIVHGRIYLGACDEEQGLLKCLDAATGRLLWQYTAPHRKMPRTIDGKMPFNFAHFAPQLGICSSPAVDDERVYFVNHRCEVVCLDAKGPASEPGEVRGLHRQIAKLGRSAPRPRSSGSSTCGSETGDRPRTPATARR